MCVERECLRVKGCVMIGCVERECVLRGSVLELKDA